MKHMILGLVALMAISACTKKSDDGTTTTNPIGCAVEGAAVSLVSSTVATQLVCKNLDAVKADIQVQVAKLNLCEAKSKAEAETQGKMTVQDQASAKSAIGAIVCGPVSDALLGGVLKTIPAAWDCTGGVPADQLKKVVLDACLKSL